MEKGELFFSCMPGQNTFPWDFPSSRYIFYQTPHNAKWRIQFAQFLNFYIQAVLYFHFHNNNFQFFHLRVNIAR
jgi:hypothetical protein